MRAEKKPKIKINQWGIISFAIIFFLNGKESFFLLTLCALGHEAGHLAVMRLCGVPIDEITVGALNFNIKYNKALTSYKKDLIISAGGVFVNLGFAVLGYTFGCFEFFISNVVLIIMNLLPVNSLDGANIIVALKGIMGGDFDGGYERLYKRVFAVSVVFAISVLCKFNLSVVFTGITTLINDELATGI